MKNRRHFLLQVPALAAAGKLLAEAGAVRSRPGICAFSCHQHWKAVGAGSETVKFRDAAGFYQYGRELGAEGVQTSLRGKEEMARQIRDLVESDGGYYEADLRLPDSAAEGDDFENQVKLARAAGATVARAVLMGGRRYEVFKTREAFLTFQEKGAARLALVEPILRRHQLKLALENHKDQTCDELIALMKRIESEWIGVLVDTGNNLALLEDPGEVIRQLAPYALSVHLKDMAVQPVDDGFLLSEVPLGSGALDLPSMVAVLSSANPGIVFNLEMATRDPLHVPCLTDAYFSTFPERREARLESMMNWVAAHPLRGKPPVVSGKPVGEVLAEEEKNNRDSLVWMKGNIP